MFIFYWLETPDTNNKTERLAETWEYHGFPVVENGTFLGYVAREKLKSFICSFAYLEVLDWLTNPVCSASPLREWRGDAHRKISWPARRRLCGPVTTIGGYHAVTKGGSIRARCEHVPQTGRSFFSPMLPDCIVSPTYFSFLCDRICATSRSRRPEN